MRLSAEEREQLEALIRKGKSPAQRLLKARILLKADVSQAGEGWSDNRIIKALETSISMVYRVRKQLVEEGLEAVLSRKQRVTPAVARIFEASGDARFRAGFPRAGSRRAGYRHLSFASFRKDPAGQIRKLMRRSRPLARVGFGSIASVER